MSARHICILGGSGFVGRHLLARLRLDGHRLKILTRSERTSARLFRQISAEAVVIDVYNQALLEQQFAGCDTVINLIGILNERGHDGSEFQRVHAALPAGIARAAQAAGVTRLLHMSALGAAPDAPSLYLQTKSMGNDALTQVLGNALAWTIFKPSVIFGPGDGLTCRFQALLKITPFVFPLACPQARFAPVYVGDVVEAFARSLDDARSHGQYYELCGADLFTLQEIVELTAHTARLKRKIIPLSDRLSRLQAEIMEYLPGKPFSRDNYLSTRQDSVCSGKLAGLGALGVEPTPMNKAVATYLA
ncbi:MAG: complex I NDUFA9 subunit family protein [Nevskiales bacterium]